MNIRNYRTHIGNLATRFGLDLIYAFGSRATEALDCVQGGNAAMAAGGSDLDVAVLARTTLDIDAKVAVSQKLEELFGVGRVDLVDLADAPVSLALDAVSGELLYAADPDQEARFQLLVLRKAADLAPFQKEREKTVLGF